MKKLIIVGASGHGKVVADIAKLNGYEEIVFVDDNEDVKSCSGYPVVGKTSDATNMTGDKFVAIGNAEVRKRLSNLFDSVTLIHPDAVVAEGTIIGDGTVVMAGAVINPEVQIGRGCIINTCASVDHDCEIGDFVHVSVGAHLCGTVSIGDSTWIGAGVTVVNNVDICADTMIGAGAVVVKNIDKAGTYIGVPSKLK
ncbi:transferase hexapeptide (six repeat-containing protein) [Lachnospiraceae bacterium A10]|nr:transferase hexapeptide (six repeat-containing protein) [Lachnospiraceae bacterium A10]